MILYQRMERSMDEDIDASSTSETATAIPAEPQGGLNQPATVSTAQERRQTDDREDTTEQTGEPQPFSSSEHAQLTLDRSSERTLLRTTPQQELAGSIRVDRSRVVVGEAVGVAWDVSAVDGRFLGHMDFLGMFEVNEGTPVEIDNLLDSKLRGVCNSQSGHVNWLIQPDHFNERTTIDVCFCYFDHQHILRAKSSTVTLVNPSPNLSSPISQQPAIHSSSSLGTPFEIQIHNLHCSDLRAKTFGLPDPFLKLSLTGPRGGPRLTHHNQKAATEVVQGTRHPHWNERFVFRALPTDLLEVTVRDKFSASRPSASHFLGRVKVQLLEFLRWSGARTVTLDLQKRLPSDRVRGTIALTIENDTLPPDPSGSHGDPQADQSDARSSSAPIVATVSLSSLRISRLTSLCSEDSIDEHPVDLREGGGASVGVAVSPGNDDIIDIREVQSSTPTTASAESAKSGNETETADDTGAAVTAETTFSEPNQQQATLKHQDTSEASYDDDITNKGDVPSSGGDNEKVKSLEDLDKIRLTLHSSSCRHPTTAGKRKSHTIISRHVSLRVPPTNRSHDLSPNGHQRLSGSTSLYQINSSDLTESLPPNWEVRSGASGMPLYYDHKNKVVRLDLPVGETGQSSPRISDFVRRSNLNLLQRQPSQPVPDSSVDDSTPLTRSFTISGDVRLRNRQEDKPVHPLTTPAQQAKPESEAAADEKKEGHPSLTSRSEASGDDSLPTEEGGSLPSVDTGRDKMEGEGGEELDRERGTEKEEEGERQTAEEKRSAEVGEEGERVKVEEKEPSVEGEDERVKSKLESKLSSGQLQEEEEEEEEGSGFLGRSQSVDESVRQAPGFQFITRPDLYKFAKDIGNKAFFKNLAVLELIQTIRSDHTLFTKYRHSSKLVNVINSFAQTDCQLPSGWEKKVDPSSNRHVFIDHNSRQTTFIDPRLPYPGNNLELNDSAENKQPGIVARSRPYVSEEPDGLQPQQRLRLPSQFSRPSTDGERVVRSSSFSNSAPPLSTVPVLPVLSPAPHGEALRLSPSLSPDGQDGDDSNYSERVVMFLRQPNIFSLLRSRSDRSLSYNMRAAIETIQREGVSALEAMQRDSNSLYFDLTILLSLFDEQISHFTFPVSSAQSTSIDLSSVSNGGGRVSLRLPSEPSSPSTDDDSSTLGSSPPSSVASDTAAEASVDMANHTYGGIPIRFITEFFGQSNIYLQVLSRFNGISAGQREYIQWFQQASESSVENRLRSTAQLRNFVDGLRTRIDEFVANRHPDSDYVTSMGGSQGQLPDVENHTLAGMTMEQILTFFRNAEDNDRILAPDVLMPLIGEYSVYELEELLAEDIVVRRVVMRYRDEIIQQQFPTIAQIKSFFRQSNIYGVIRSHVSVNSEDRETVEFIVNTPEEILTERLMWDISMKRFIRSLAGPILAYDEDTPTLGLLHLHLDLSPLATPMHSITPPRSSPPPSPPPPPPVSVQRKKQQFIDKLRELQRKLERGGYSDADYTHNANFNRTSLLADAYRFIMGNRAKDLRRRRLNVHWGREEGLDYGGPQREFFFKLSRELFNPYYGLFEYSASGSYTVQISPQSTVIEDAQQWFRFAGRLIGYAIIQGQLLDVFFARHIYKALLGSNYTLSDIEAIDIPFYNSLKYVLENDPEPLELTFTVLEEVFGQQSEYELRPGGASISVSDENKQEYVDLMVQWRLSNGILPQTESMVKGLREMIPPKYLDAFDAQELEWVIAGTPEINLEDWKNNTVYWGGYYKDHQVIRWFWQVVEAYSTEQKLRLLQFVIGTSSIPFEGFKALRGSSSFQKFTIDRKGGTDAITSLPIAHTCFNRMDLPEYPSLNILAEKLTLAIEECGSFENA